MHTISRSYSSMLDLGEIKAFITSNRSVEKTSDFPTFTDLDELFQSDVVLENTRLWLNTAGQLCAYAFVYFPFNNLTFEIEPSYRTDALEDEIYAWAEGRMLAQYGADLSDHTLDSNCRAEDTRMQNFFQRHGFKREEVETVGYLIELQELPAEPNLPSGFSIRPLDAPPELNEVVHLLQAAYGTENFSEEDRRAVMNTPAYLPNLDLVCAAPDGRLAGNCICGIEEPPPGSNREREGYTDPVVVHPDFQKRGIATAMLLSGLRGLYAAGITRARLGTRGDNTGMRRAAEAAGFRCVSRRVWFSKQLA